MKIQTKSAKLLLNSDCSFRSSNTHEKKTHFNLSRQTRLMCLFIWMFVSTRLCIHEFAKASNNIKVNLSLCQHISNAIDVPIDIVFCCCCCFGRHHQIFVVVYFLCYSCYQFWSRWPDTYTENNFPRISMRYYIDGTSSGYVEFNYGKTQLYSSHPSLSPISLSTMSLTAIFLSSVFCIGRLCAFEFMEILRTNKPFERYIDVSARI